MKQVWELKKLGEVCDLQNGYAFKSTDYIEFSNTVNFRMSQIRPGGGIDLENNPKYLPDNFSEIYKEYLLKKGDVVVAMTDMATETKILGVPTIIPDDNRKWLLNQRVGRLFNVNYNIINVYYLKYILTSNEVNNYYKALGRGGLQINIGKQDILNVSIPVPPLPEQERIISILDQAFSAIEQAKANAEKNLKNAKELFDSYLNGVFTNKGEDWEEKTLKEISKINYGYTEKTNFEEIGPKFLRITDIQNSGVDWDLVPYCKCNEIDFKKYKLETGDIVFARTGATTGKSYLLKEPPNAVFASYLIRLQLKNKENFIPEFISYFFMTNLYWDKIKSGISGSAQGGVNASKLGEIKLYYPKSLMLQQDIVKKLNAVLLEAKQLEELYQQKITQLEDLKKSILQKAFNGELL